MTLRREHKLQTQQSEGAQRYQSSRFQSASRERLQIPCRTSPNVCRNILRTRLHYSDQASQDEVADVVDVERPLALMCCLAQAHTFLFFQFAFLDCLPSSNRAIDQSGQTTRANTTLCVMQVLDIPLGHLHEVERRFRQEITHQLRQGRGCWRGRTRPHMPMKNPPSRLVSL